MKGLVSTLAAASLCFSPLPALAQSHMGGGHFGGGGHFSGGGFSGGHFGRFGGGFSGLHRFRHFDDDFFPFFGGFAFGLALDPWFYGDYWGPWGPYYDHWYYDDYDGPPPPPHNGAAPQVCGQWDWRPDQNRYVWTTTPCASGPPPAPSAAPPPPEPPPPHG